MSDERPRVVMWPESSGGILGWQNPVMVAREVTVRPVSLAGYLEHPGPCKACGAYYGHNGQCKLNDRQMTKKEKERAAEREFSER